MRALLLASCLLLLPGCTPGADASTSAAVTPSAAEDGEARAESADRGRAASASAAGEGADDADSADTADPGEGAETSGVWDFAVTTIDGRDTTLREWAGNALLIVNTASECGFTGQYRDLQELWTSYGERGLVVMGFPANNFGNQEPGSDEDIAAFCTGEFGVTFPMFSKVEVVGDERHPLFTWLSTHGGDAATGNIRWNFEKFLVSPEGVLVGRWRSQTRPTSRRVVAAIEDVLPEAAR